MGQGLGIEHAGFQGQLRARPQAPDDVVAVLCPVSLRGPGRRGQARRQFTLEPRHLFGAQHRVGLPGLRQRLSPGHGRLRGHPAGVGLDEQSHPRRPFVAGPLGIGVGVGHHHLELQRLAVCRECVLAPPPDGAHGLRQGMHVGRRQEARQAHLPHEAALRVEQHDHIVTPAHTVPVVERGHAARVRHGGIDRAHFVREFVRPDRHPAPARLLLQGAGGSMQAGQAAGELGLIGRARSPGYRAGRGASR